MYGNKFLTAAAIGATVMLGAVNGFAASNNDNAQKSHEAQTQKWAAEKAAKRHEEVALSERRRADQERRHATHVTQVDAQNKEGVGDLQEQRQSFAKYHAEKRRQEIALAERRRAEHARLHAERIAHAHHK